MSKTGEFIGNTIEAMYYTFSPVPSPAVLGELALDVQAKREDEMVGSKRRPLPFDVKNIVATVGIEVIRYAGTYSIFANTGDINLAVAWFCGMGASEWVGKKAVETQYKYIPYS